MYLLVSLDDRAHQVLLRELDNFAAFKVVVEGAGEWGDVSDALAGAARVDPPHAWVDVNALRDLGRSEDAEWCNRLSGMVEFARGKGWLDEGGAIRAHCEWGAGSPEGTPAP